MFRPCICILLYNDLVWFTPQSQTPRARGAEKAGPTKSLFRNDTTLTNLFEEVEEEEEMDEEEKDYYWSDED